MTVTTFDPEGDLIIVHARLWGAQGQERELRLVVDTGAGPTIIAPELLDELGYSARNLASTPSRTSMRSSGSLGRSRPTSGWVSAT